MSRPTAPCLLCRNVKLLAESHFLPKAHYKLIRDAPNGKSAFVGSKESVDTTRQVKKYLLCDECEDRFNARGENWVQANSLTVDGEFQIRDALRTANAHGWAEVNGRNGVEHISIYSGIGTRGIEIDRLTYFAASVFWRAAVTDWNICGRTLHRLQLGPYQTPLRDFLMDEGPFPEDAALIIFVASEDQPLRAACFPIGFKPDGRYYKYNFHIPGIGFVMSLGKRIPQELRRMCAVHSPSRSLVLSDMGDRALGGLFMSLLSKQKRDHG
jgi:hypothetical protein